jgi:rRNA-processing protein FCF1
MFGTYGGFLMKKLKVYIDTSVINFLFADDAPDFKQITIDFFHKYIHDYDVFVSDVVLFEINKTESNEKREQLLNVIEQYPIHIFSVENNDTIDKLANLYIVNKIIPEKKREDALHIAISTFFDCDILLSWNFKHLANIKKQIAVNAVNQQEGFLKKLNLLSPLEVECEEE